MPAAAAALPYPCVPRTALVAARFLRPPGKFKRAELREHPRSKTGAFANLIKTAVRLREKARAFSLVPPPRLIPLPLPHRKKQLESVRGVPTVCAEVLARRLHFLLGPAAIEQQKMARMQRGLTPYQAELFMWERQLLRYFNPCVVQMREIRKIYRAQYLQRLAEVTEEERRKQLELYLQEKQERRLRREEQLQRIYEDKKRRAVLKDRIRIEKKVPNVSMSSAYAFDWVALISAVCICCRAILRLSVTQSLQTARVSRRKIGHLLWLKKLQDAADFMQRQEEGLRAAAATAEKEASGVEEEEVLAREMSRVKDDAFRQIDTRHISVPDLLAQLGTETIKKERQPVSPL
ncbi:hypothetical protein CSUI_008071 [Cystoisospora suis]|uniref:Uncharacterized protein n=1 Tax=Cystoisospora suis TaxID=483139 RepID=A0A2C6KNP9_9APIC|nr:hypothetical protein CSUI_008071 [Cystoisospora suis]